MQNRCIFWDDEEYDGLHRRASVLLLLVEGAVASEVLVEGVAATPVELATVILVALAMRAAEK